MLLILWIWGESLLKQYFYAVLTRIPIVGQMPDLIFLVVFAMIVILAIKKIKISSKDLLFIFAVCIVFFIEYLLCVGTREYIEYYFVEFIIKRLPLFLVAVSLVNNEEHEKIIEKMYYLSVIILIIEVLYTLFFSAPMNDVVSLYQGDMDEAYKILPHCCLIAAYSFKQINIKGIALMIVSGLFLLMLGTRGAALLYIVQIVILVIKGRKRYQTIIKAVILGGASSLFLLTPVYYTLLNCLSNLAKQLGLSVRIFDKLFKANIGNTSGRDVIMDTIMTEIKNKPIFGNGLCADRVILNGGFSHNIILEMCVDFGVVVGIALLIIMILLIIRGVIYEKDENLKILQLSLFLSSFCMMFLSGSFLDEKFPLFLLGLSVASARSQSHRSLRNVVWRH